MAFALTKKHKQERMPECNNRRASQEVLNFTLY